MSHHSIWISSSFSCLIIQFLSHYPVQLCLFSYPFRVLSYFIQSIILFVLNYANLVQLSILCLIIKVRLFTLFLIVHFLSNYTVLIVHFLWRFLFMSNFQFVLIIHFISNYSLQIFHFFSHYTYHFSLSYFFLIIHFQYNYPCSIIDFVFIILSR